MRIEEVMIENITYDMAHKCTKFEFSYSGDITSSLEEMVGKKLNLELKKAGKRSNNANRYLWSLLGELQAKLRIPKEEIYRHYIYGCGVYSIYCMQNEAVEDFKKIWCSRGLGWVTDETPSKIQGCTNVLAYKGTSEYNRDEMSVLLSQVVEDCEEQGIPTKRQEEIESLLKDWSNENEK